MIDPKILFAVSFVALCVLEYIRPRKKKMPLIPKTLESLLIKTYRQEPDGTLVLIEALPKIDSAGRRINKRGGSKMKYLRALYEPGIINDNRIYGISSHR